MPEIKIDSTEHHKHMVHIIKYIFMHPIGYIFFTPNWVHVLCTKLGTHPLHPIRCMNYVPNWVTISMMPLSRAFALESPIWSIDCVPNWVHYGLHPIGYKKSYTNDILKAG